MDLVDRAGLTSVWLFLRDLEIGGPVELFLADVVVLIEGLVGEGSRDGRGDGAAELLADAEADAAGAGAGFEVGVDFAGWVCTLRREGVDDLARIVEFEEREVLLPALDEPPLGVVL